MFETVTPDELLSTELDDFEFGVIRMNREHTVTGFNRVESESSGLSRDRVMGRHFFEEVAPCMNNFMVAQKFLDPGPLDEVLDYVLTLRMAPTPVRLRLLREEGAEMQYVLVERA